MAFDNIHNYYETAVVNRINDMVQADFIENDQTFLEDVACVALNQLPARYIKHDIDLLYYMTTDERDKIEYDIHRALTAAVEYVTQHRNKRANSK